jgi:hypothetical protein
MNKPITPAMHAALDYSLAGMQVICPEILGLNRRATALSVAFGTAYGATAAITDTPLAVKPLIAFEVHGAAELPSIAAMVAVPWLSGAMEGRRERMFFLGCAGMALMNFFMTDFNRSSHGSMADRWEDAPREANEMLESAATA